MRHLFFLLCGVLAFGAQAQRITPVFQIGHPGGTMGDIEFIDTDPAHNLLLTADKHAVMLWNTLTGGQLRVLSFPGEVKGAVLCADARELAVALVPEHAEGAGTLQFFETATGKALSSLPITYQDEYTIGKVHYPTPDGLIRSPDGQRLAVQHIFGLSIVSVHTRRKSPTVPLPYSSSRVQFAARPGTYFVAFEEDGHLTTAILDSLGKVLRKQVVPTSKSPEGTTSNRAATRFYVIENSGQVLQFDSLLASRPVARVGTEYHTYLSSPLSLSPDGTKLLVGCDGLSFSDANRETSYYYYYDLTGQRGWFMPLKAPDNDKQRFTTSLVAFCSADAQRIVCTSLAKAALVELKSGRDLVELGSKAQGLHTMAFNATGTYLASRDIFSGSTHCLNLTTGQTSEHKVFLHQWLTDSLALCTNYRVYNEKTGETSVALQLRNMLRDNVLLSYRLEVNATAYDKKLYAARLAANRATLAYIHNNTLCVAQGPGYARVQKRDLSEFVRFGDGVELRFSPDSHYLVASCPNAVLVYDIRQNRWATLPVSMSKEYGYEACTITPDSKQLLYYFLGRTTDPTDNTKGLTVRFSSYNLASGAVQVRRKLEFGESRAKALACHPTEALYATGFENGTVELRQLADDKLVYVTKCHESAVVDVQFRPGHPHLASLGRDAMLALTDYRARQPVARLTTLLSQREREKDWTSLRIGGFALVTAQNYYLAPTEAVAQLHYADGLQTYSFEQFDLRYNRPDKVLQALGSPDAALIKSYRLAYEKRMRRLQVDTTAFETSSTAPIATVANRNNLPITQAQPTLTLHLQATDASQPLRQVQVWVNEVPIFGTKGRRLSHRTGLRLDTTVVLTLSTGANRIETSVTNAAGAESYRSPLFVTYTPAQPVPERVYFVGIGINHFASPGHDLQWSVKDIRDLAVALREKYGAALSIDTLFDAQVTVANVQQLREKLRQSRVDDKVLVAYSGHGLLSADFDYFLSTYDIDFEHPATRGLPYEALENLLDGLPARRKLLLLDACHSGEVDKDALQRRTSTALALAASGVSTKGLVEVGYPKVGLANSFELMQTLFANVGRGTGTTVISAASGTQFALERNNLRNGVFTSCILTMLRENSSMSVASLQKNVNQRVAELTHGLQVPTTRASLQSTDWNVW